MSRREASRLGTERDQLIARLRQLWPAYASYETTAGRTLRVFRLERISTEPLVQG